MQFEINLNGLKFSLYGQRYLSTESKEKLMKCPEDAIELLEDFVSFEQAYPRDNVYYNYHKDPYQSLEVSTLNPSIVFELGANEIPIQECYKYDPGVDFSDEESPCHSNGSGGNKSDSDEGKTLKTVNDAEESATQE